MQLKNLIGKRIIDVKETRGINHDDGGSYAGLTLVLEDGMRVHTSWSTSSLGGGLVLDVDEEVAK